MNIPVALLAKLKAMKKANLAAYEKSLSYEEIIEGLMNAGFTGLMSVSELRDGALKVTPDVSVEELEANWIDGTPVVYIGKATSLRNRITKYVRFGQGKPVGHWGGRYIWQQTVCKS